MKMRSAIIDFSKGDFLFFFWMLFRWRGRVSWRPLQDALSFFLHRMARRHGGYIGKTAVFRGRPVLPHGLHGIYVSRYAVIGKHCRIYQNVTIGSIGNRAPRIGDHCLIGAGACIVGGVRVGDYVKIGAGAVVRSDVPSHTTVVSQPPRMLSRGTGNA